MDNLASSNLDSTGQSLPEHKRRVIVVDGDRKSALAMAAALKGPDLQQQLAKDDNELFQELDKELPALVILRAELEGNSGYSICNRLRAQDRTAGIKVVIVAMTKLDPHLQSHRDSKQRADGYVSPPRGLKELRAEAYGLLGLEGGMMSEDDVHAIEEDPFAQLDAALRPMEPGEERASTSVSDEEPAPSAERAHLAANFSEEDLDGAFGALSENKSEPALVDAEEVNDEPELVEEGVLEVPKAQKLASPLAGMNEEDLNFVNSVFSKRKSSDPLAPPIPANRRRELRGPELKLEQLRDKLREKEQELQRLQSLWEQNESKYAASAQLVLDREVEVTAAQMEADELSRKLKAQEEEAKRQRREYASSNDRLLEEKVLLEKDLIEVVASKEKNVNELRRMLASRERDLEELRLNTDQARAAALAERQQEKANDDQALAALGQELANTRIEAAAEREATAQARAAEGAAAEAKLNETIAQAQAELARRDQLASEHLDKEHERANQFEQRLLATEQTLRERQLALAASEAEVARLVGVQSTLEQKLETERASSAAETAKERALNLEKVAEQERLQREAITQERAGHDAHLQEEMAKHRSELETKERDLQTLWGEFNQQKGKLNELMQELGTERTEKKGLLEQLQLVQKELAQQQNVSVEHAKSAGQLQERFSLTEAALNEKVKALSEENTVLKNEKTSLAERLGERLNQKDQQIAQKGAAFEQIGVELAAARSEREALQKRLSERLAEREASIAQLTSQLEELKQTGEKYRREQELERQRLLNESEKLSARVNEIQQQATTKLEDTQLQVAQLKQELKQAQAKGAPSSATPEVPNPAVGDDLLDEVGKKLGTL